MILKLILNTQMIYTEDIEEIKILKNEIQIKNMKH